MTSSPWRKQPQGKQKPFKKKIVEKFSKYGLGTTAEANIIGVAFNKDDELNMKYNMAVG